VTEPAEVNLRDSGTYAGQLSGGPGSASTGPTVPLRLFRSRCMAARRRAPPVGLAARAKTKKEAVNLALQFYAEKQERAARIARHFERARH
jgi:hypothetical protein